MGALLTGGPDDERVLYCGVTDGADRLYAGIYSVVPNRGAASAISVYANKVARTGMSLMQMAVGCGPSAAAAAALQQPARRRAGAD